MYFYYLTSFSKWGSDETPLLAPRFEWMKTLGSGIRTHLLVFEDDMQGGEGCRRDETPEVELVDVQDVVLEGLAQLIQDRVLVLQQGGSPGVTLASSS